MNPLVVLDLGKGNCLEGLPVVTARLWLAGGKIPVKCVGSLPPAPDLPNLYHRWRALYQALHARLSFRQADPESAIEFDTDAVSQVSEAEFRDLSGQLQRSINRWLNSPGFLNIDRQLRTKLVASEQVRVIIETDDPLLQKLPWHLWHFFEQYTQAEVALSAQEYEQVSPAPPSNPHQVRILVILGHSDGIDIQCDRTLLEQLPDAEMVILTEPQRSELDRWLWDEAGWDILFFAGHSASQAREKDGEVIGQLSINAVEQLSIEQLKHALRAAIVRGLKLAIFNSCDGLGLARALSDLNIPQIVVMREPVTDRVAQIFLKNFLKVFSRGEAFYPAIRQAREQLQGVEGECPGASWLPVIYQNPTEVPMTWPGLLPRQQRREPSNLNRPHRFALVRRLNLQSLKLHSLFAVSLAITCLVFGVRMLGWLQPLELQAYDRLMQARPAQLEPVADPHLLVVEITEEDTDEYGYPLRDEVLASAIETLQQYQPRAIGLDLHRYQAREPGREQLMDKFKQHPNLFTVCSYGLGDRKIYGPPPEFSTEQLRNQVGFSDLQIDGNPENQLPPVRRQLLSYDPQLASSNSGCMTPFSLSFHLAFRFLADEGIQPLAPAPSGHWQLGPVVFHRLAARTGGYQNLDGQSDQILVNYRFHSQPAKRVSLQMVLNGSLKSNWVKDRIILIGTTDPIGNDYFDTPYGSLPGVWVHAHLVSQMLQAVLEDRPLLWVLPQAGSIQWGDFLWIWGWAMIGSLTLWRSRTLLILGLAIGIIMVVLNQICLFILVKGGWMPLIPALLAFLLTAVGLALYASLREQRLWAR